MAINSGRVVVGALVGGVVANAIDMIWNFVVLKDDMAEMAKRFGIPADTMASFSAAVPFIVVDFILVFVIVWTYAAMRPRLGPGSRTAILAGLVVYVPVTAVLWGFTASLGMMPMGAFIRGSATSLITTVVSSLVGCALYRELATGAVSEQHGMQPQRS